MTVAESGILREPTLTVPEKVPVAPVISPLKLPSLASRFPSASICHPIDPDTKLELCKYPEFIDVLADDPPEPIVDGLLSLYSLCIYEEVPKSSVFEVESTSFVRFLLNPKSYMLYSIFIS